MDDARPLSVLIVEDEAMVLNLLRQAVGAADCAVAGTAPSVAAALALLDAPGAAFDAALLDANLRGVSSAPVAARLRDAGIPFIVITGYTAEHVAEIADGAPVLRKPFRAKALAEALRLLPQPGPAPR